MIMLQKVLEVREIYLIFIGIVIIVYIFRDVQVMVYISGLNGNILQLFQIRKKQILNDICFYQNILYDFYILVI